LTAIKLIAGLGNPGAEYAKTRHNVGAWFISMLADSLGQSLKKEAKFHGVIAKASIDGHACFLFSPSTYMNESGLAISAVARFYKITPEEILVVHDELDYPAGTIRFKSGGGHGGHNGLRNTIDHLSSREFQRLRIGIDHPGHKDKVTPYVLGEPSKHDKTRIVASIDDGINVISDLICGQSEKAMLFLHQD
jgi:PTH1 family peptidyl-tRNA hydrolase